MFAFDSFDRWPIDRPMSPTDEAWDVVPDLAVEVTSPIDLAEDLLHMVAEYFKAGVRMVWVVYPDRASHPRLRRVGSNPDRDRGRQSRWRSRPSGLPSSVESVYLERLSR